MPLRRFLKILFSGLFVLAILFIVAVEFSAVRTPESQPNYESYEHAAKELFDSAQSLVVSSVEWFGHFDADDWIAIGTGVLAVATVLLWLATQRILRESKSTTRQQSRAYLFIKQANLDRFAQGKRPFIHLHLRNSGQTPAWNVRARYDGGIYPFPDCPDLLTDDEQHHGVLGPNMNYTLAIELSALKKADIESVEKGTAAIYVFGRIDYEDAFGRPQWTKFRFLYGGPMGPSPEGVMIDHKDGNDASR
jgi:hypothetical protein